MRPVNVCVVHASGVSNSCSKLPPPCQRDYKRNLVNMCGVVLYLVKTIHTCNIFDVTITVIMSHSNVWMNFDVSRAPHTRLWMKRSKYVWNGNYTTPKRPHRSWWRNHLLHAHKCTSVIEVTTVAHDHCIRHVTPWQYHNTSCIMLLTWKLFVTWHECWYASK